MDVLKSTPTQEEQSIEHEIDDLIIQSAFGNNKLETTSSQECCNRNIRRRRRKNKKNYYKHRMEINEIYLDYEDLHRRVASLQKRAVIGRWMFPDNSDLDNLV